MTNPPLPVPPAPRRVDLLRLSVAFRHETAAALVETAADLAVSRTDLVNRIVEQWLCDQGKLSPVSRPRARRSGPRPPSPES